MPDDADDFLDGCELDFTVDADDDETAELRPLFPDGVPSDKWQGCSPMGRDTGISERMRANGLRVVDVDGWQTRGSTTFNPRGSVNHHTAGPLSGNAPSLGICINGRTGLPGPLCNVFQARDNTIYVVAAGRANHAGLGGVRGLTGNSSVYGLEVENTGYDSNEPWRDDQVATMARVHIALGVDPQLVVQHHEWTTRKIDAHDIDGDWFRGFIMEAIGGGTPPPTPPHSGTYPTTGKMLWPPLTSTTRIAYPVHTSVVQQVTGATVDGNYGPGTAAAVGAYQRGTGRLSADGKVGPMTATYIVQNILRDMGLFTGTLDGSYGMQTSVAVARLQEYAGIAVDGSCGPRTTDALWFFMPR